MAVTAEGLKQVIEGGIKCTHVEVKDTSGGCGQSYDVIVVSEEFEGLGLLKRHRLVNEAAASEISQLHAFSQKNYTPAQWETHQQSLNQ